MVMNTKTLIAKISDLIKPIVEAMGYIVWGCELVNGAGHFILKVYIDSEAGINLGDCQKVSNQIGAILEVESLIKGKYALEVSSPGIDRFLFNAEQYKKFINSEVRIRLSMLINGRRTYVGKIVEVTADSVSIVTTENRVSIPINQIEKAKVIPHFEGEHYE
jgi:ribosome maturation factor RimP